MARSRRRTGGRRRRFVRKDWVYTEGGYLAGVFSQGTGPVNALAQPLLWASGAERIITIGNENVVPGVVDYTRGFAKPEPRPQVVYAVEGTIHMNPSGWALGNEFLWGWRLMIYKMDAITGQIEVDADYSMWENAPAPFVHFAYFRNSSDVLAEGRIMRTFSDSGGNFQTRVRWSSTMGRRLEEDEGLYLWLEGANASVTSVRNRLFFRTLAKAP